ncbi:hypothetical protein HDU81_002237 [Chytriomyces hyalinus]|nr:hypothetical protein HDU81_002237 [Chytriomyces hyalinus]
MSGYLSLSPTNAGYTMLTLSPSFKSAQSAVTWGAALGLAALWIIEPTPIARRDVLQNIPVIGVYWKNKLEKALQVD